MTPFRLARRMAEIQPFRVMEILARAQALEAQGHSIVHLEIGEPDFPTPSEIVAAGIDALRNRQTFYTPSLGLPALRAAIAAHYPAAARPAAEQVVITPGASGALMLIFGVLINPGDEVLMTDPGYPGNRHFVRMFEGRATLVPVEASSNYQLNADLVRQYWTEKTRAVLISSPSNPTGTILPPDEMGKIVDFVRKRGGVLIVDEIYHGLTYGTPAYSALHHGPDIFVLNSFSKYYGMTGWRVGWLVAPPDYIEAIDRLAQNVLLATNTPAQHAALAAFQPQVINELNRRRDEFQARRDYLLPALQDLGFAIPVCPQGAFYLYADVSDLATDSYELANRLLAEAGVAITPGQDFGQHAAERYVRFSYARPVPMLQEAIQRLAAFFGR